MSFLGFLMVSELEIIEFFFATQWHFREQPPHTVVGFQAVLG